MHICFKYLLCCCWWNHHKEVEWLCVRKRCGSETPQRSIKLCAIALIWITVPVENDKTTQMGKSNVMVRKRPEFWLLRRHSHASSSVRFYLGTVVLVTTRYESLHNAHPPCCTARYGNITQKPHRKCIQISFEFSQVGSKSLCTHLGFAYWLDYWLEHWWVIDLWCSSLTGHDNVIKPLKINTNIAVTFSSEGSLVTLKSQRGEHSCS